MIVRNMEGKDVYWMMEKAAALTLGQEVIMC